MVPDDLRRTLEQGRGGEPNSESERAEAGRKKVDLRNKQEVFNNINSLSQQTGSTQVRTGACSHYHRQQEHLEHLE